RRRGAQGARERQSRDRGRAVLPRLAAAQAHRAERVPHRHHRRRADAVHRGQAGECRHHRGAPRTDPGRRGPLWSERANPYNAESKLYPRALAFAENLWRGNAHDDAAWADFHQRLEAQYPRLDAWHVAYGPEDRAVVQYAITVDAKGG